MSTAQEVYRKGVEVLKPLDDAELEARLLLCEAASITDEQFYSEPDLAITDAQGRIYLKMVKKRLSGTPVAYLTGKKEFWSLSFRVEPGVLIPRPETELVVEKVLELASGRHGQQTREQGFARSRLDLFIADIGTGSGCIAVSLAKELPQSRILATDVSADALDIARRNAEANGVSNLVFEQGDLYKPLLEEGLMGAFDFIVSNPPYVTEEEWETLDRGIREHEPRGALVAGETGLEVIEKLVRGVGRYLKPRGYLVLEIGFGQQKDVLRMFGEGWGKVRSHEDLAGIPRVITAQLL
ncbi:MAG: peptide chain release factor N(5)-glutamine methyltransferase [Candidatus Aminicenantaceae bacterium]